LIIHKTKVEDSTGSAGTVIEASNDRLVVAARQGAVRLVEVQVPGKRALSAAEFIRGYRIKVGDRMGTPLAQ
jgi:methionyl-tRNA formyltransferase